MSRFSGSFFATVVSRCRREDSEQLSNLKRRFQRPRVSRPQGQYSLAISEPVGGDETLVEQLLPFGFAVAVAELLAVPAMPLTLTISG